MIDEEREVGNAFRLSYPNFKFARRKGCFSSYRFPAIRLVSSSSSHKWVEFSWCRDRNPSTSEIGLEAKSRSRQVKAYGGSKQGS